MSNKSTELYSWIENGTEWEMPHSRHMPPEYISQINQLIESNSHLQGEFQLLLDDDWNVYAMVINEGDDFYSLEKYMGEYGCTTCLYHKSDQNAWSVL